jgi:hypothetical protein
MNMFTKALALAGIGLALSGLAAQAQTAPAAKAPPPSPAAVAAAAELLGMKKAYTIYQNIVPTIIQRSKDSILQNNLNYQKDLEEISVKLATELGPRREEIGRAMAQIYATTFTEQELKDLIAFYKSPLGKKFLETEPQSIQSSINFMNQWSAAFANEINERFRAELKARGKPL